MMTEREEAKHGLPGCCGTVQCHFGVSAARHTAMVALLASAPARTSLTALCMILGGDSELPKTRTLFQFDHAW